MKPPNPIQITQIDINLQELHCVCKLSQGGVQWSFNTRFSIYQGILKNPIIPIYQVGILTNFFL